MTRRLVRLLACTLAILAVPATTALASDPADPGRTQTFTYGSGLLVNPYIVYTPTSYNRRKPMPLLVMAHGCQTTAYQQMRANLYNQLAEREGFVVLYPDIDLTGTLQPGPTVRCWRFFNPDSWQRDQGDAAAIAGMTRAVLSRWNIDRERVYMMGMSGGSFMTAIMAAAYPDLYAADGEMAGGAYGDFACLLGLPGELPVEASAALAHAQEGPRARVLPIIVLGGDADAAVTPPCADKALMQGLRTDNLALGSNQTAPIRLTPASVRHARKPGGYAYTVSSYRDAHGCLIGQRWLIHGMNHFWSGGSTDPRWAAFTDPKGPSAAAASWAFLSRFRKSQTARPC